MGRKERKDKRILSILPTYFLVVKSIAPAPPPSGQHIFANLKSSQEKKKENIIRKKFAREIKKIIMFLLTVQQNIQIFSFFLLYLECYVFQRERNQPKKKSTKDD